MPICFAILAHTAPKSLRDLVANLRHFAPASIPLIYNSSGRRRLFRRVPAPVYPGSRPLGYGLGTEYILDLMEWSLDQGYEYDYFVVWDNDMLLIRHGLEAFLHREMRTSEYMGVEFHAEQNPFVRWHPALDLGARWQPAELIWPQWPVWRKLLGTTYPYGAFNPGQTLHRRLVEKIVGHPRIDAIKGAVRSSQILGLAEVLFPTLAVALGANPRAYPREVYARCVQVQFTHWGKESITREEVDALLLEPDCYFVHPVKPLLINHPVRKLLRKGRYGKKKRR